ncbi:MAG: GTPase, partial [Spirochaetota bacterium]
MEWQRYEADDRSRPTVAIVGRPNVGKSTLFNRLVGRRRAITDPTPGVTRDPVIGPATLTGSGDGGVRRVRVVDTGGYTTDPDDMSRAISERALAELNRADAILLVVDATGLTALDELFLERLRPYEERLLLVVNKVDNPERMNLVWDFYQLGLPRVVGVSAAHGRGYEELVEAL